MIKVTVWNEYRHELQDEKVKEIYPEGIHGQLASFLADENTEVKTVQPIVKEYVITAYCPCMKCCGKTDGITVKCGQTA